MKVLVVGAGSVGQVYGQALQKAGVEVGLFVKEKYAPTAKAGFNLYALNEGKNPTPIHFKANQVFSQIRDAQSHTWDFIFLCIPSDGVDQPGFTELIGAFPEAIIVSMIPGESVYQRLTDLIPADRFAEGMIGIISYPSPLPGEFRTPPGTAFWNAPFSNSFLLGPKTKVMPLVKAF